MIQLHLKVLNQRGVLGFIRTYFVFERECPKYPNEPAKLYKKFSQITLEDLEASKQSQIVLEFSVKSQRQFS